MKQTIYHPSVLVDYEMDSVCINCGTDKDSPFAEYDCDYFQDENYETHGERHEWNKEVVKIPTFAWTEYKDAETNSNGDTNRIS